MRRTLLNALSLAIAVLIPGPCRASVVTVPDDYSTIQAAIDVGADTVLVREGEYAEAPQAYRGVALIGIGFRRPRLDGLAISNPYGWLSRDWSVAGIDFGGPVTISTLNYQARGIKVALSDCALDSGLQHVANEDSYDIRLLSITRCRLPTSCYASTTDLTMEADTIDVGVRWTVNGMLRVVGCWFRGGPGRALDVWGDVVNGEISSCLFENYRVSVWAPYVDSSTPFGFVISSNVIRGMSVLAMAAGCFSATLSDNTVEDCSEGIRLSQGGRLRLIRNALRRCGGYGFWLDTPEILVADGNVISHCAGSGIIVEFSSYSDLTFTRNTFVNNAGSGIDMLVSSVKNNVIVENNIAAWNGQYGLLVRSQQPSVVVGCNDWFENGVAPVYGATSRQDDCEVDPGFCDLASDSVSLYADSPLLSRTQCGLIGARGVGCWPPALKELSVASNRAGLGVQWELESAFPVESWIERADQAAGPWDSLGTGARSATNGFELLDAAVAPDRAYHYRVAWKDRGAIVRGSPVVGTWVNAGRLSSVTPSPARGEATVEWVASRSGTTEIQVFDLSGREVATLARTSYGVGRHQALWDGRWEGRGSAPAGMYVVRISSADGTSTHRIVLLR